MAEIIIPAQDIRWHQRSDNFDKALGQLAAAVELSRQRKLSQLEEQGLIQAFEFTYELSWDLIKDYYENQGEVNIQGSRDSFRLAFKRELISEGEIWMSMIKSRVMTSHTYDEKTAAEIAHKIINQYYPEFAKLNQTMNKIKLD